MPAQTQVGPLDFDIGKSAEYWPSGYFYWGGSGQTSYPVGRFLSGQTIHTDRVFFQWNFSGAQIPEDATVASARLQVTASGESGQSPPEFNFWISTNDYDLSTPPSAQTLYLSANSSIVASNQQTSNFTYTADFGQSSDFVSALQASLSAERFVIGIVSSTEGSGVGYSYRVPGLGSPFVPVKLTIWIAPQEVTADQVFEDDERIQASKIGHWEENAFAEYVVPEYFEFELNTTQTFRADTTVWPNETTNYDEKYHTWNASDDVVNHRDFLIQPGLSIVKSQFRRVNNATIQAQLLDGGNPGGTIDFKDPWLIDTADAKGPKNRSMNPRWRTQSSPFSNTTSNTWYKGVFLNQSFGGTSPYYSVGAPFENTINSHLAYFQNWSGSSVTHHDPSQQQTPVVFIASGATSVAQYKGKLLSSVSNPTGSNSQRVVAGIPYGTHGEELYALAYPSAGELWWNVSFDNGSTWWNEKRFTNSGGTASAPSIALWTECVTSSPLNDPCDTDLYAVYRKQSGGNYQIMFTIPPFPEAGISSSVQLNSTSISTNIDTRPVITRVDYFGGPWLYAFWEGTGGLWMNFAYPENGDWEWAGEDLRYSGYLSPSVSGVSDVNFFLTYDNRDDVKIIDYVGAVDEVVPASVAPLSRSSQVSANTSNSPGEAHVVWEASNPQQEEQQRVMYQRWYDDNWDEAHEFASYSPAVDFSRPTVSSLSSGKVVCAWDNGSSTYKAENEGEEWMVTEVYESLIHPNLVIAGSNDPLASTRIAGTAPSGPPHELVFGTETDNTDKSTLSSVVPTQYGRRAVVARRPYHEKKSLRERTVAERLDPAEADTSAYFFVEVSAIDLKLSNGTIVPLEFTNETSPAPNENSVWSRLSTSPLTLPANVDSVFVEGVAVMHGFSNLVNREIGLSFDVIDADNGTLIKRVNRERIYQSNGKGNLSLRDRLEGLHGRRVFLKPTVRGFAGNSRNLVTTVVHVHTVLDELSRNQNLLTKQDHSRKSEIPTTFAVHANYPNPFNPSTTIKFELPENSSVSLVVYDVLGREVAQLVSGSREAGYHSATWDASNMSSGVYFARFTATDANGSIRLNKVNKLLLTK
ncbi:MAG: T9SS type A sorting domain-containing protein [Bacteroidetes bacterium]|nr:T9SS type A sorting domain-containing protein [Bacteroidota bacterium]